jgi:hypothetical protein
MQQKLCPLESGIEDPLICVGVGNLFRQSSSAPAPLLAVIAEGTART